MPISAASTLPVPRGINPIGSTPSGILAASMRRVPSPPAEMTASFSVASLCQSSSARSTSVCKRVIVQPRRCSSRSTSPVSVRRATPAMSFRGAGSASGEAGARGQPCVGHRSLRAGGATRPVPDQGSGTIPIKPRNASRE